MRKFVRTTDSDHDGPIFPNLARDLVLTGPHQLWVGDILYPDRRRLRLSGRDPRRLVASSDRLGLGRQIDTRLTLAALRAASESRRPPRGCVHHSDRGAQYVNLIAENLSRTA